MEHQEGADLKSCRLCSRNGTHVLISLQKLQFTIMCMSRHVICEQVDCKSSDRVTVNKSSCAAVPLRKHVLQRPSDPFHKDTIACGDKDIVKIWLLYKDHKCATCDDRVNIDNKAPSHNKYSVWNARHMDNGLVPIDEARFEAIRSGLADVKKDKSESQDAENRPKGGA